MKMKATLSLVCLHGDIRLEKDMIWEMENVEADNVDKFMRLDSNEEDLPEPFVKKAEIELRETRSRSEQSLKQLKELINECGNVNLNDIDTKFLMMYLRAKKFDPQKAFDTFQNLRRAKSKFNIMKSLSTIDPIREIWKSNITGLLPYRDADGRAILVHRAGNWDPMRMTVDEVYSGAVVAICLALLQPMTQVNGFVFIIDLKGITLRHIKAFSPSYAYILVHAIQDCLPGRCKGIHILNENIYYKYAYALMKNFLREKLRNRIFLHGDNMESFHKYFPPQILSSEFDGKLGVFDNSFTLRLSERNEDRLMAFIKMNTITVFKKK